MSTSDSTETKEIEIQCEIPQNLPNYTCIEYPGQINNINNAIDTLGGNDKIQQTFTQFNQFQTQKQSPTHKPKEPYLELHLNPNGVFDHALFGKIRPIKNCILIKKTTKIKKRNKKRKFHQITNNNNQNNNNNNTKLEVIGRINSLVTYDDLCDFQVFSELKYPKNVINDNENVNNKSDADKPEINIIRKTNKRRRIWSLAEDDIPNISKYPLIPQVFAAKAQAYDVLKQPGKKAEKSPTKQLETKPTEIMFKKKQVPIKPKNATQWMKWVQDLKAYKEDKNNRKIPKSDKEIKDKLTENEKMSFCRKIRNEIVIQIEKYFEEKAVWNKTEILLKKFYIYWYYIKYFADRIEITNPNDSNKNVKISESDTFYDVDIANIVFDRKQKNNFCMQTKKDKMKIKNNKKIYLEFKEKEKIISKFLGVIGYKFRSGPFRNSFVRFGFDPRDKMNKHIARSLQIIDYRIGKTKAKNLSIIREWSGGRTGTRGRPQEQRDGVFEHLVDVMKGDEMGGDVEQGRDNDEIRGFLGGDMDDMCENDRLEKEIMDRLCFRIKPDKLNMYYQLMNIDIDEIKKIVYDENENSFNDVCLKDCGWILKKDEGKIRDLMNERLEKWIVEEKERIKKEQLIEKLQRKKKDIVVEDEDVEDMNDIGMNDDVFMMEEFVGGHETKSVSVRVDDDMDVGVDGDGMYDDEMVGMFDGQLDDGDMFQLL